MKKGQSTLDYLYLLIVTATVIAALGGKLQPKLQDAFTSVGSKILTEINKIK